MRRLTVPTTLAALITIGLIGILFLGACERDDNTNSPATTSTADTPPEETAAVEELPVETPGSNSELISHTPCNVNLLVNDILNADTIPSDTDFAASNSGYFASQLLISGRTSAVSDTISLDGTLKPLATLSFPDPDLITETITIGLVEYVPTNGVDLFAKAVEINAQADADDLFVRAEPNYLFSTPQRFDTSGFPGSPGIEGSPGSPGIEGSGGGSNPISDALDLPQFQSQWAFTSVVPFDSSYLDPTRASGLTNLTSPTVDLVLFDSSPLTTGAYHNNALCVHALLEASGATLSDPHFADSHGIFAASLAGPLAHEGTIQLVQVLKADDSGALHGDLFTLLGSIQLYDQKIGADRQARMLDLFGSSDIAHTVINLSLGFTFNPTAPDNQGVMNSVRTFNDALPDYLNSDHASEDLEMPVVSLRVMLERLDSAGYVIVAAAGNDGLPLPQTPAAYPEVIGVEAFNSEGQLSCFSNHGNVSAPGGGSVTEEEAALCDLDLTLTQCAAGDNCAEAITGHVWSLSALDDKLGYWVGTSFAAPFVSGLAQSVAEYGVFAYTQDTSVGYPLTTAEVRTAVYCTANNNPQANPNPAAADPSANLIVPDRLEDCVNSVFAAR